jgi:hypothetical protein
MNAKRKAIETRILEVLDKLDPSGDNSNLYKEQFKAMDDVAFDKYMKAIKNGEASLYFRFVNLQSKADISQYIKVAKELKIDVFTRLRRIDSITKQSYLSPKKYMVLELPVRRMVQYAVNKRSVAEDNNQIDALTGQVTGASRAAGITGPEIHTLSLKGLHRTLDELVTVRGGHIEADAFVTQELMTTGKCRLKDIPVTNSSRTAASAETIFRAMGLDVNITDVERS